MIFLFSVVERVQIGTGGTGAGAGNGLADGRRTKSPSQSQACPSQVSGMAS